MVRIALATAGVAALIGCSDIASEDLLTSGIYADISVTADGSGSSEVGAVLRAGGALSTTFVELTGDDELTATHLEETRALSRVSLGTLHTFNTSFDSDEPGVDFIVALERTVDAGAPNTVIQLPEPFEIEDLTVTEFSRGSEPLTVTWTPSGSTDTMRLLIDGDCFLIHSVDVSGDPGTHTVEAGTLESTGESETSCEATVRIERRRGGDLDAGYGSGGSASGVQVRTVTVGSAP